MKQRIVAVILFLVASAYCQQVADTAFQPPIEKPAYENGKGPRVVIDGGHHNFHTVDGRYLPFAQLLRRDGYQVSGSSSSFTPEALRNVDVLVVANALNAVNAPPKGDWTLPTPSAFTRDEIAAVKSWIQSGGALFLIVDHMPFPGAAGDLARSLGVEFSNGFAGYQDEKGIGPITFTPQNGLKLGPWTEGRSPDENVDSVVTFTGSAFYLGGTARPVLQFGDGYVALTPYTAWQFTPETPRVPIGGWCQGAVLTQGKGRVAIFGEAAMFTAQLAGPNKRPMGMNSPEAKQNYRFLRNLMHWLSRTPGIPQN